MRPAVLAACLALVVLAWPAAAQVTPARPGEARVVIDAVFWALPGPAAETCLQLPPSQVAITVSIEDGELTQPEETVRAGCRSDALGGEGALRVLCSDLARAGTRRVQG